MSRVLITGGTGTLGRQLVHQFSHQGFDVGFITTRAEVDFPSGAKVYHGDLTDRDSISRAVGEAEIIIHCASKPADADRVDVEGTRNLLALADPHRLRHLVYVSIAGVDRSSYRYYQAKFTTENLIQDSPLPWSILRATQFHDFVLHRLIGPADRRDGSPLALPASLRFQTIDVSDAALHLREMALGKPLRQVVTIGGPEILTLGAMARAYLAAQNRNEDIHTVDTGQYYEVFKSGINVNPEWATGKITWETFLKASAAKTGHQPA